MRLAAALENLPALPALEREWRELESRVAPSFFLSWDWIGLWLELLPPRVAPRLLRVKRGEATAGLAIVCAHGRLRSRVVPVRRWLLNSTGDERLDELTTEYNGLLCARSDAVEVTRTGVGALLAEPGWDELAIDGLDRLDVVAPVAGLGLRAVVDEKPDHFVEFASLRAGGQSWLDALEPRVRAMVRRTLKECQSIGAITFEAAKTADEALAYLSGLERLHTAAWAARGKPGSFAGARFGEFHRELVRRRFADGRIQLSRLRVGDAAVGFLYNFAHGTRVYAYQSGFDLAFASTAHWRPGVACHALAIEAALAGGASEYRFMAGAQRYKRQMANAQASMAWVAWQRPRWRFGVERALRAARERLRGPAPSDE